MLKGGIGLIGDSPSESFSHEDPTKTCEYCRRPGTATQVDHSITKSVSGNATIDNAQLTCPYCNQSKGNRTLGSFLVGEKVGKNT